MPPFRAGVDVLVRPIADIGSWTIFELTNGQAAGSESDMARAKILQAAFHCLVSVGLLGCGSEPEESEKSHSASSAEQVSPRSTGQCPTHMGASLSGADRENLWNGREDEQPLCLFIASTAWAQHDRKKASDLFALAMVRFRYDAVRCAGPVSQSTASAMTAARMAAGGYLSDLGIFVGPEEIGAAARNSRSYVYSAQHLQALCDGQVKSENEWPALRVEMQDAIDRAITNSQAGLP